MANKYLRMRGWGRREDLLILILFLSSGGTSTGAAVCMCQKFSEHEVSELITDGSPVVGKRSFG